MQRQQGSGLGLFPEPIDLNQGSAQSNTNVDSTPPSWGNDINPIQTQLLNSSPSFSRWDRGQSSSSGLNLQGDDESCIENAKSRAAWPSSTSCNPTAGSNPKSDNWFFEPFDTTGGTQGSQTHSSNRGSLSISHQNHGLARENDDSLRNVLGSVLPLPHNIKPDDHETEQIDIPNFCHSSVNLGDSNSGSAFGSWGSSCKRKAVEGTNTSASSSSSNQLAGKNVVHHHGNSRYNSPGNLMISSGPLNPSSSNHSQLPNSSVRDGIIPPGLNFSTRFNLANLDQVPNDPPLRRFGVNSVPQPFSRPIPRTTNSPDLRSTTALRMDPNGTLSQAQLSARVNDSRRTRLSSSPWNGSMGPQSSSSSSSYAFEEANNIPRSSRRHDFHHSPNVSVSEARNSALPDQIDWSFAPETSSSSSSGNLSHGSRSGSSSNIRASSSGWLPRHHYHQTPQNHHLRFSEAAPWIQYPRVESEPGNNNSRRSHFGLSPSPSEAGSSSRGQRRSDQRPAAPSMDVPDDDVNGWHALTAIEERHRVIRQALNAMQRGVRLQAEDFMMIDTFIDEFAELHDRHRDMRLDVDNMSYEELLALGEDIGNVSTGLSEEEISHFMKQRKKHGSVETSQNSEPCCICREDYGVGDFIGILDCMHEFHTGCIKQWLTQKNLCPICKMTALETREPYGSGQQHRPPA